eukprot:4859542-Amphidinium_carterae.1
MGETTRAAICSYQGLAINAAHTEASTRSFACGWPFLFKYTVKATLSPMAKVPICRLCKYTSFWKNPFTSGQSMKPKPHKHVQMYEAQTQEHACTLYATPAFLH